MLPLGGIYHGESTGKMTAEYRIWRGITQRCCNPKRKGYLLYGGRGITFYEPWRNSYPQFLADVGRRPSPKHSLDRFPNKNGNYEPGNVRWATPTEQARNQNSNKIITINGVSRCISEWAEISGVSKDTLCYRLRAGYKSEELLLKGKAARALRRSKIQAGRRKWVATTTHEERTAQSQKNSKTMAERYAITSSEKAKILKRYSKLRSIKQTALSFDIGIARTLRALGKRYGKRYEKRK